MIGNGYDRIHKRVCSVKGRNHYVGKIINSVLTILTIHRYPDKYVCWAAEYSFSHSFIR